MDASQEAKPRIYTHEEFRAEVDLAQEYTNTLVQMMPVAATLYGVAHPSLTNSQVADRVFELATALAWQIQQHIALDMARLEQAKHDSGL